MGFSWIDTHGAGLEGGGGMCMVKLDREEYQEPRRRHVCQRREQRNHLRQAKPTSQVYGDVSAQYCTTDETAEVRHNDSRWGEAKGRGEAKGGF